MSNNNVHTEIKLVTPEWAAEKLAEHNKRVQDGTFRQRKVDSRTYNRYAADMINGNWALTAQGLSWDVEGNLMDGQHRLYAVVKAKVPVRMLIMTGLPVELDNGIRTIDTLDTGRSRTFAHQLRLHDVKYATAHASTVRMIALLANGLAGMKISPPQGWALMEMFSRHTDALLEVLTKNNQVHNSRGYLLAPLVLLRCVDKDTADLFATEYSELTGLKTNSPVLQLHKYLVRPGLRATRGGYDFERGNIRVVCTALFYYSKDKPVEYLKGNTDAVEWLLGGAKNAIKKVQEIIGENITVETLSR